MVNFVEFCKEVSQMMNGNDSYDSQIPHWVFVAVVPSVLICGDAKHASNATSKLVVVWKSKLHLSLE